MIAEHKGECVGTCHLTCLLSLTFKGTTRLQIEAVHVKKTHQGQKIGERMMHEAFAFAQSQKARIVQLTTNKKRVRAQKFYKRLGFEASHEGMKKIIK